MSLRQQTLDLKTKQRTTNIDIKGYKLNTHLPMPLKYITSHKKTNLNISVDKISTYTRKMNWNLLLLKYLLLRAKTDSTDAYAGANTDTRVCIHLNSTIYT